MNTSIVIPTYNGKHLLERFLPSVVRLMRQREDREIIVVDDGSDDGTSSWLKKAFPEIHLLALSRNVGFGKACNKAIVSAKAESIILLNNDVEVVSDIPYCLEGVFTNESLFGVAFDMVSGDTDLPYANRILPRWKQGLIAFELNGKRSGTGFSYYACGGGMALSRGKYLALGGFDTLFQPYYWEDTDLSYRAWKRGWQIIFHPGCRVRHYPSSTIGLIADERRRTQTLEKNRLLFLWKNLTDRGLLMEHLFWLPRHILSSFRRRDQIFGRAFLQAVRCLPQVLQARERERKHLVKKDSEIFGLFVE